MAIEQAQWDLIISSTIIIGLILAIWAKISQQTIVELLRDMKEFFQEKNEDMYENAQEVVYA